MGWHATPHCTSDSDCPLFVARLTWPRNVSRPSAEAVCVSVCTRACVFSQKSSGSGVALHDLFIGAHSPLQQIALRRVIVITL